MQWPYQASLSRSHHPNLLPPSCPRGEALGHQQQPGLNARGCSRPTTKDLASPPCQDPSPSLSHQPPPRSSEPPWGAWLAPAAGAGCRLGGHAWPAALAASPPSGSAEAHFVRRFLHPAPSPRRGGGSARGQAANCSPGGRRDEAAASPPHRAATQRRGSGGSHCGEGWVTAHSRAWHPPRCWGAPVAGRDTSLAPAQRLQILLPALLQLTPDSGLRTQSSQARLTPPCEPPLASPLCRCTSPMPGCVLSRHPLQVSSHVEPPRPRRGSHTAMPSGTARHRAAAGLLALLLTLFNEDVN